MVKIWPSWVIGVHVYWNLNNVTSSTLCNMNYLEELFIVTSIHNNASKSLYNDQWLTRTFSTSKHFYRIPLHCKSNTLLLLNMLLKLSTTLECPMLEVHTKCNERKVLVNFTGVTTLLRMKLITFKEEQYNSFQQTAGLRKDSQATFTSKLYRLYWHTGKL